MICLYTHRLIFTGSLFMKKVSGEKVLVVSTTYLKVFLYLPVAIVSVRSLVLTTKAFFCV